VIDPPAPAGGAYPVDEDPSQDEPQGRPAQVGQSFARIATRFAVLGLAPLMLAVSIDLYLITSLISRSVAVSAALSGSLLALFGALWLVYPRVVARRRRQAGERRPSDVAPGEER
jgi:hypothetical protein